MKIDISIVPDGEKKERAAERKIGLILRIGFSVFLALVVLSGVLFFTQFALNAEYSEAKNDSQNRQQNLNRDIEETEDLLTRVNILSKKIQSTSEETPRWSKVLTGLSQFSPAEIRFTLVSVEKEHIIIKGFSKTREAFLDFQTKLGENGYKNLKSPISNLVSPKDFNFEVEADFDKSFLVQS
jgi:Tfp pilus assembly protein PilN